ncbi:hypothetical protein [Limosilactobacillus kribbianus]|uniref:hypothetical protein n=1 Tax=Limosilactobacillus kribbianus TaxID=2982695 RepID=UPI00226460F5|nr:hypothetical protein [Limosilactobacillus kribbianus]
MFTFMVCLPWLIIIAVFLVGVIVNLINGDHLLRRNEDAYESKHGKEANNNE